MADRVTRMPNWDDRALKAGDESALMQALLGLAARWFQGANSHLGFPCPASEVALRGDSSTAGLLAAASELRALLAATPQGRKALGDLGLECVLQYLERE